MRIWKRIFLYSFILFIVVFNGAGVITIENINSKNVEVAVKTALSEGKDIVSTIYLNSDLFYKYEGEALWKRLKNYLHRTSTKARKIEVFNKENHLVMETTESEIGIEEKYLKEISTEEYRFIFRNISGKKYISVKYGIKVFDEAFKIVVTNDVSYLDIDRLDNYKMFLILSILATFAMAIGLYIISKAITKPIEKLIEVSNNIKNGDYSERAICKSRDEIGILSENFNSMMSVIEENIDDLKVINEAKQRFIDNLTHEMKTPITSILGYSELLLKGNVSEEIKRKSLVNINFQGKRLENLNTSLVGLIIAKKSELKFTIIDANEMIKALVENTEYRVLNKEMKLIRDIKKGNILGEKNLIDTMLINFVENAVKASKEKSIIEIKGYPLKGSNKYRLIIKDYGVGISKEDLKKVKEPFFMVDKARNTKGKNMGLGLALCSEICLLNKIDLEIESNINVGTKIILDFKMESNNEK